MISLASRRRWGVTVAVVVLTLILLSPFYWVVVGSFTAPAELFSPNFNFWPKHLILENWSLALNRLWPHVQNSLLVGSLVSIGTLTVAVPAAYGLVWLRPRGGRMLFSFLLMTQMLPAIVFVIPLFIVFSKINLVNNFLGLVLADMTFTTPFALIMLCAYMKDLPYELVESALVSGANQAQAFRFVVLPVVLPGLVTVGMFSFLIPWADLIYALSLITEDSLQPLTVELYKAMGQYGIDWSFLLPGSVLTAIPAVLFVVVASRFIIAGVTQGAIK